jgi:hypothetical protein
VKGLGKMPEKRHKRRKAISDFSNFEVVFVNDQPLQANDPVLLKLIKETLDSYIKVHEDLKTEK